MALRQKAAADSGSFEPAPEGTHRAVCTRVIDQGTQPSNFGPKRKLLLGFELEEKRADGSRFMAFQNATLSTHPKSRLRGLLERWRGRRYDDGDEINIAALVGKSCLLTLVKNGEYTNIDGIAPLMKGMEPLSPDGDTIIFDCDEPDLGEMDKMGDNLRRKIEDSPEYRAAMGQSPAGATVATSEAADRYAAETRSNGPGHGDDFDDDIPF